MDFIEIKIRDFAKLIKRNDIKCPQWFAMPNDILLHPDFIEMTGNEFKVFVWILGVASKLNKEKIRVYPKLCARQSLVAENDVLSCIEKLHKKRWDSSSRKRTADVTPSVRKRTADVTPSVRKRTATRQDKTEQDSTEHNITKQDTNTGGDVSLFAKPPANINLVIAAYCDAWKSKYGDNPPIGGKEAGIIKSLVKDFGLDRSIKILQAYLNMPDSWFITKRHDLVTLKANLNSVSHFISTGKLITKSDLKNLEQTIHTNSLIDKIKNGEL